MKCYLIKSGLIISLFVACNSASNKELNSIKQIDTLVLYVYKDIINNDTIGDSLIIVRYDWGGLSRGVYYTNLKSRPNIKYYYKQIDNEIFTDSLLFESNNLTDSIPYYSYFDTSGTIVIIRETASNRILKRTAYYPNGIKKYEQVFKLNDTILNHTWYSNGMKRSIETFHNERFIFILLWDEYGNLYQQKRKVDSLYVHKVFYENGQVMQETIYDSMFNKKVYKNWCENGTLVDSSLYNQGKFSLTRYFCNGRPREKLTYINEPAFLIDSFYTWYENGKLEKVGFFKITDKPLAGGTAHGTWKFYDSSGNIIAEKRIEDGIVIEEKKYHIK